MALKMFYFFFTFLHDFFTFRFTFQNSEKKQVQIFHTQSYALSMPHKGDHVDIRRFRRNPKIAVILAKKYFWKNQNCSFYTSVGVAFILCTPIVSHTYYIFYM